MHLLRAIAFTTATAITGAVAFNGAAFGEGSREIVIDGVECSGTETSLNECVLDEIGSGELIWGTDCNHTSDVGIRCLGKKV